MYYIVHKKKEMELPNGPSKWAESKAQKMNDRSRSMTKPDKLTNRNDDSGLQSASRGNQSNHDEDRAR